MKAVSTKKIRWWLTGLFTVFVAVLGYQFPKAGGALAPAGEFIHETRADLLGAEKFHTRHSTELENWDQNLPFQHYGMCESCTLNLYINTSIREVEDVKIMNIVPKFKNGIELPPGEYDLLIEPRDRDVAVYREMITLKPGNNRFEYKLDEMNKELYRVND